MISLCDFNVLIVTNRCGQKSVNVSMALNQCGLVEIVIPKLGYLKAVTPHSRHIYCRSVQYAVKIILGVEARRLNLNLKRNPR